MSGCQKAKGQSLLVICGIIVGPGLSGTALTLSCKELELDAMKTTGFAHSGRHFLQ